MHLKDYTFVALDLETTGLSPIRDTIIEVAAVRFHLEKVGEKYIAITDDERSMLIDPERKLEENISMITGITDSMLKGKVKWGEVKEKVREFIGDSIIVGHNVLFDTAMLESHGIDLSRSVALDTFELSEIFSQESESLNLGFLAEKYGFKWESEHRALDDVKLSIWLFCHYLSEICHMDDTHRRYWKYARSHDSSHILWALLDIVEITWEENLVFSDIGRVWVPIIENNSKYEKYDNKYSSTYFSWGKRQYKEIVESSLEWSEKVLILAEWSKDIMFLKQLLEEEGLAPTVFASHARYLSRIVLREQLEKKSWKRKETIFLLKLLSWSLRTETGLLDELKFYGEEREYLYLFRMAKNEENIYTEKRDRAMGEGSIIICDIYNIPDISKYRTSLIVSDTINIAESLRKKETKKIDLTKTLQIVEALDGDNGIKNDIITSLSLFQGILEKIPERPTWPEKNTPGEYGETYFIKQKDIWHYGFWVLIWIWDTLESALETDIFSGKSPSLYEERIWESIRKDIRAITTLISQESLETSIILNINGEDMSISLVPRNIRTELSWLFEKVEEDKRTLLVYGKKSGILDRFLLSEYTIETLPETNEDTRWIQIVENLSIKKRKTVILTTSTRHIREICTQIKGNFDIEHVFGQWISWGKAKMATLFARREEKSVLVWLIDTWQNEYTLWENTDEVILIKIPFDPPTDPYYLARTVGMKNNFEEYSMPMALSGIESLIIKILLANENIDISISDDRLSKTNWGQVFRENMNPFIIMK